MWQMNHLADPGVDLHVHARVQMAVNMFVHACIHVYVYVHKHEQIVSHMCVMTKSGGTCGVPVTTVLFILI